MNITLRKAAKTEKDTDLLIIATFMAKGQKKGETFEVCKNVSKNDQELDGFLALGAQEEGFLGKEGQTYLTATLGRSKARSIALLGLGDPDQQSPDLYRRAGGEAFKLAHQKRIKKMTLLIPDRASVAVFDIVQALAEGLRLASYQFDRYRSKDKKELLLKEVELACENLDPEPKPALTRAEVIAAAVNLARDLINEGPTTLNPLKFAEHAKEVGHEAKLSIDILDEKKLKKEKMGLMLAVASAAEAVAPPRLIKLHYQPKKKSGQKIALIGKGVTFDSGGLDLKTADGMLDMKVDMSGAAAVLGAMQAIGKLMPKVEVIGYMACVENGVGPHAYHPGDILHSRKGTTVEISNTDAEGRLVLADAITYAIDHDQPNIIIDIATLTGACMVALGLKTAGIFANDDALFEAILSSGSSVGEAFWRLPLNQQLKEGLKSPVADIKNCGDRYGGSITAALFLEEFIEKNIKWAHLDIAGPATNSKAHPYLSQGGVGFGVRTLVDYVMGLS